MSQKNQRETARQNRKGRIRKRIFGTEQRPRLSVFRSAKHIYAQLVIDSTGSTILAASTLSPDLRAEIGDLDKSDAAKKVGQWIGKKALEKNIQQVVFDRNGFLYHGRIKALADGARESGLVF
ncbi:MAG: 50S ribosomal protein L18 [Deltaproteobacteria bacterium]|jgi:large subunit ribosomal protein L18|uniref:50S ribosomal protein L18 n=1 Tax=Candidatus Deferrimicrobium sp. TaxID=3060586 RepID=UPI002717DC0F|nr:50S ribosomal protein L18 [Candidatus Deferrimicrobium sp.]MCR4310062.1 50S ribosomal protein L18 [Deltaproteobacteria bacterium]MDO8738603.1 50S ribosomal protein L18 [Candidatus Deferrimicrobium sp.]MDP2656899.1 50S ribosomal protein L18 [Candidatus Deferrimicrobium sp.]